MRLLTYELSKVSARSAAKIIGIGLVIVAVGAAGASIDLLDRLDAGELDADLAARMAVTNGFAGLLFATLMGANLVTSEDRHGTAASSFVLVPRRARLIVAKAVVAIGLGAAIGLASAAVALVVTTLAFAQRDVDLVVDGDVRLALLGTVAVCALSGPWGLAIGAVVKKALPTAVIIIAFTLVVETTLLALVPRAARYLPGGAQAGIIRDLELPERVGMGAGLVLFTSYVLAGVVVGAWSTERQELT